jgi:hypothetical protein
MLCCVGTGTVWVCRRIWFQKLGREQKGFVTTLLKDLNPLGTYNIVII